VYFIALPILQSIF